MWISLKQIKICFSCVLSPGRQCSHRQLLRQHRHCAKLSIGEEMGCSYFILLPLSLHPCDRVGWRSTWLAQETDGYLATIKGSYFILLPDKSSFLLLSDISSFLLLRTCRSCKTFLQYHHGISRNLSSKTDQFFFWNKKTDQLLGSYCYAKPVQA